MGSGRTSRFAATLRLGITLAVQTYADAVAPAGAVRAGARRQEAGALTREGDWWTVALPADDDGATVPDLVRDLVGLGVRVHAVGPGRISLRERLLDILRTQRAGGDRRRLEPFAPSPRSPSARPPAGVCCARSS